MKIFSDDVVSKPQLDTELKRLNDQRHEDNKRFYILIGIGILISILLKFI